MALRWFWPTYRLFVNSGTATALFVDADDVAGWSRALSHLAADETLRLRLAGHAGLRACAVQLGAAGGPVARAYASATATMVTV